MSEQPIEDNTIFPQTSENVLKKKPLNFRTEMLKGVHSPSDVLSPFSQKINLERNSALKKFKPKSLIDRLLSVKSSSQLGSSTETNSEAEISESEASEKNPESTPNDKKENLLASPSCLSSELTPES